MLGKPTSNTNGKIAATFRTALKLAKMGNAEAQFYVGYYYFCGQGVAQDTQQAVDWFLKAADQGNAAAQYNMGACYFNGNGVEKDAEQAAAWYRQAADQGLAEAQHRLGICYENGKGVENDAKQAADWYRQAAAQGNADAQRRLGTCYFFGKGVENDAKQGVDWYRKAAAQGNANAQYRLGICYENGWGVKKKDAKQAVAWFGQAATQGHADAQNRLEYYFNGQDIVQAAEQKLATNANEQKTTLKSENTRTSAETGTNHSPHPVPSLNSHRLSSRVGEQKNLAVRLESQNEYIRRLQKQVASLEEHILKQDRELQRLRELVATLFPTPTQSPKPPNNPTIKLSRG